MSKDQNYWLRDATPEEIAKHEDDFIRDVPRMARLPLVRSIRERLEELNEPELVEAFHSLTEILALWKRIEVRERVMLKRAIRAFVGAGLSKEEVSALLNPSNQ